MGGSMVKRWRTLNWFNSYLKECNHVWQAKLHWKGWKGLLNHGLKFKTLVSNLSLCFWCNTCPDNKYISWSIIISSTGLGLLWFSIPIHLSLGWWWSQQLPALDSSSWRRRWTGRSFGSWKTVSLWRTRSGSESHFLPGKFLYWHILAQNFSNPVVVKATYSIQIIMNECQLPCHSFFFTSQSRSSFWLSSKSFS